MFVCDAVFVQLVVCFAVSYCCLLLLSARRTHFFSLLSLLYFFSFASQ